MNKKYSKKTREALRKNDNFRQAVKATAVAITGALQEFLSSQDYTVTKQPDLEELQHVLALKSSLHPLGHGLARPMAAAAGTTAVGGRSIRRAGAPVALVEREAAVLRVGREVGEKTQQFLDRKPEGIGVFGRRAQLFDQPRHDERVREVLGRVLDPFLAVARVKHVQRHPRGVDRAQRAQAARAQQPDGRLVLGPRELEHGHDQLDHDGVDVDVGVGFGQLAPLGAARDEPLEQLAERHLAHGLVPVGHVLR